MSSIQRSLRISASALTAERLRMDVISNNVANSQTTRTARGEGPYRRKRVVFLARGQARPPVQRFRENLDVAEMAGMAGVKVQRIVADSAPPVRTYDPTHPDADTEGFVEYPNVDVATEMVDMMAASRAYQANITVIQTLKGMAQKALEIGRG